MEEEQFQRLLELFPVVRTSSYCADEVNGMNRRVPSGLPSSTVQLQPVDTGSPSQEIDTGKGIQSPPTSVASLGDEANFWDLLKTAAEKQLSPENAQRFCDTFKARHNDLVNNTLSLDAIERIAKHWPLPTK
ncbi:hypothetical protein M758_12G065000 [Ceratodon purpureus]|uniref:Uncharacterized protein n=1 Tax=Ceratodon purpureus TaxID=3225 RepID=A0A8T0G5D6_CERPU|nr:hypothetical protein KC19_12G063500 [Ceratodon purpureus]KAG0598339.1 hypothetical protein M758_12G065000 [Ceratodon purpureus]